MVKEAVSSNSHFRTLGAGVVLTGGGANLRGMESVAEQVFDLHVRTGRPHDLGGLSEIVEGEGWSAGVGLLLHERHYLLNAYGRSQGAGARFKWMINGLKRIASLF